jgi:predicted 3-demethylubiquinone-9 3-methyltransferase (glyoxalase superfamily)
MGKIKPFLWFDSNAEEAADFYLTVFPNGRKLNELRSTEAGPGPAGSVIVFDLELEGQEMTFLNGGPGHPPTVAFSFYVLCETQAEIDDYWAKLTDGGSEGACGWLQDKFGLSWQIAPAGLKDWLKHPDAMRAMMQMKKMDIAVLKAAAGVE